MSPGTLSDKIMTTFLRQSNFPELNEQDVCRLNNMCTHHRFLPVSVNTILTSLQECVWTNRLDASQTDTERQNKDLNTYMALLHWPLFILKLPLDECNKRQKWITLRLVKYAFLLEYTVMAS